MYTHTHVYTEKLTRGTYVSLTEVYIHILNVSCCLYTCTCVCILCVWFVCTHKKKIHMFIYRYTGKLTRAIYVSLICVFSLGKYFRLLGIRVHVRA